MEPKVEEMENMEEMDRFLSVDFFHFFYLKLNPSPKAREFLVIERQNWADLGILSRFDTIFYLLKNII